MAKNKKIAARIMKISRFASVLALALLLLAQLAVPAFAAQSGPAYEGEAPEITEPNTPAPGQEEPGEKTDKGEAPEDAAPPDDAAVPPEDAPPAEGEPEAGAAAAGEVEPQAGGIADGRHITVSGVNNGTNGTWAELTADSYGNDLGAFVLFTGEKLTIMESAGSPENPVTIVINNAMEVGEPLKPAVIEYKATTNTPGQAIIENLRIQVAHDQLTLHIIDMKMRMGVYDETSAAIDYIDNQIEGYTGLGGTLIFEGENKIYATAPTNELNPNGAHALRALDVEVQAVNAASTLELYGSPADAVQFGGDGISFAGHSVNNQHNGLVIASDTSVQAFGGDAYLDQATGESKRAGHGVSASGSQFKIYGKLTATGGNVNLGSCTQYISARAGNGFFVTGASPDDSVLDESLVSFVAQGGELIGHGGAIIRDESNTQYSPGGHGVYISGNTFAPIEVAGTLSGTGGHDSHGVYISNIRTTDSAVITGIGKGGKVRGIELELMADYPLKGTINASIEGDEGLCYEGTALYLWGSAFDEEDATYEISATLNATGAPTTGVTQQDNIALHLFPYYDTQTFRITGMVKSDNTDPLRGSNLYLSSGSLIIAEGAEVTVTGMTNRSGATSWAGLGMYMGNLTIEGTLNATGASLANSNEGLGWNSLNGPGLSFHGGKLTIGATAKVTLAGGHTRIAQGLPFCERSYSGSPRMTFDIHPDASIKTPWGEDLYMVRLDFTAEDGKANDGSNHNTLYFGDKYRLYNTAQPSKSNNLFYVMLPKGPITPFDPDDKPLVGNSLRPVVYPLLTVSPNHENVYSYDCKTTGDGTSSIVMQNLPLHPDYDIEVNPEFRVYLLELAVGESYTFDPLLTPANGNQYLTWEIKKRQYDDTLDSVVTFDNGTITGVAEGLISFSVYPYVRNTIAIGSQSCTIYVKVGDAAPRMEIQAAGTAYTGGSLAVGKTLQLSAVLKNTEASSPAITWKSNDTGVATVSTGGLVTPKAVGTTKITASATVEGNTVSASVDIEVVDAPVPLTGVTIRPASARLALGGEQKLEVFPNPGASVTEDGTTIAWEVFDSTPADVATVTAIGNGKTATLKASETVAGTAKVRVTVTPAVGVAVTDIIEVEVYEAVTGLELFGPDLSDPDLRMLPAMGGTAPTATLTAVVQPATATPDLVWRSTNHLVVAVKPSADGKSATLTSGLAGSAVISVSAADGAFVASCTVTVGWAEGTLALTEGTPPAERDYLLLVTTDSAVTLDIAATSGDSTFPLGTPTDLTGTSSIVQTAVSPAGDTLTIKPTGTVTGTVYVCVGVPNNPNLTAVCKVVVYEADGGVPARRRMENTTLTVYRRQQSPDLRIPLMLEDTGTPWKLDAANYTFAHANAEVATLLNTAFKIEPHEDGQSLKLVKQNDLSALTASQYKVTITVTPKVGEPSAAPLIPDTLTIKLSGGLPKLTATAVTIESFGTNRTADIIINGLEGVGYTLADNGTSASVKAWATLNSGAQTIAVAAGTPKKSGTYKLAATLNGWDPDTKGNAAKVNVSLKVNSTYTAPQLKLNKTTVTVFETVSKTDAKGMPLQLLPKAADATLAGLKIENLFVITDALGLTATEAKTYKKQPDYKVTSYDAATGAFTLGATATGTDAKYPAGKVLLGAKVTGGGDWLVRVPVTVKVVKQGVVVKLAANATSITMNQQLNDPSQQTFTFVLDTNTPGYDVSWDNLTYTLKRGKVDAEKEGGLAVEPDGNRFTVRIADASKVKANTSYKLVVSKPGLYQDKNGKEKPGSITLTIKTAKTNAKVTTKLSVTGKTDLTTGAYAVVTAKLANYLGGYTTKPTFTVTPPKSVPADKKDAMKDAFDFEAVGSAGVSWRIVPKAGVQVYPGTYTVIVSGGTLPGVATAELPAAKAVKFTVSATKPKVTQSATKVTMYPADQADTATVTFTLPAGTAPVRELKMKGDAGLYDYTYREGTGTVTISFKQTNFDAKKVKSKTLTFEVYLAGNAKVATSFKVSVTAKVFKQ